MNKCHFNKELSAYLDGQLAQDKKEALEEHLKACSGCREELSQLTQLSRRLKEWQAPELGPFFAQQLKEELLSEGQGKERAKMNKKNLLILVPSSVLAAVLLFVFVGHGYIKRATTGKVMDMASTAENQFNSKGHSYAYDYKRATSGNQMRMAKAKVTMREGREGFSGTSPVKLADNGQYEPHYNSSSTTKGYDGVDVFATYARSDYEEVARVSDENGQVLIVAPVMPMIGEGERVIRTASVALEVENGKETYKLVERLCVEFKGHIVSTSFYRNKRGQESGRLILRVPKDSLSTVMDKFNSLGKVENVAVDTKDVSEAYAEISAQLQTSKIVYDKALEALKKRQGSVSDALKTESELTPILMRIESLKNQLAHLDNDIAYATITMEFHEAAISQKALQESTKEIKESFIKATLQMVGFFAGFVAMFPALVLILVVSFGLVVLGLAVYKIIRKGIAK